MKRVFQLAAGIGGLSTLGVAATRLLTRTGNPFGPDRPTRREPSAMPPGALDALDAWLAEREAAVPELRPGVAKTIVWHDKHKRPTPWAVVYVHGFSASHLESAPLAQNIARTLGANLFLTRISGHGQYGDAMGRVNVQDWLADTIEAAEIGHLLGERVLMIGASTGATLLTWLALRPEGKKIAAYVFLAPNFGLADRRSEWLNTAAGSLLARLMLGANTRSRASGPMEELAWTTWYPTRALFPMLALVRKVRDSRLEKFRTPLLVMYSEKDERVCVEEIRRACARIGAKPKTIELVDYSRSKGQHVLAGDIKDPQATERMSASIVAWVRSLPARMINIGAH